MWVILKNKIPTGDNLLKRAHHGPFWCHLCKCNNESAIHLFIDCKVAPNLWLSISIALPSPTRWQGALVSEAWSSWWTKAIPKKLRNLPLLVCWGLWIARNNLIFQKSLPHWPSISSRIISDYSLIPEDEDIPRSRTITPESIDHSKPWAYFDGFAQEEGCEGGAILNLFVSHSLHIQMGLGGGTNNFAELFSAKFLIQYALQTQCRDLQLFGDSKIVCDWINKKTRCSAFSLFHILDEAHRLITTFDSFTCQYIYRERNADADSLSKEVAHRPPDT